MLNVKSYEICGPIDGLTKSYGIWASCGNASWPVAYIKKPKHLSKNDFDLIVRSLHVTQWPKQWLGNEWPNGWTKKKGSN